MYKIIQKRKIWLTISSVLAGLGLLSILVWGLRFGIDFTGGSLMEVNFKNERPASAEVQEKLADLNLGSLSVQPVEEQRMILRFQETNEDKHQEVLNRLIEMVKSETDEVVEDEQAPEPSFTIEGEGIEGLDIQVAPQKTQISSVEELRFDSVGPSIGQELKQKSIYAVFLALIAIVLYIGWTFRKVSKPVSSWKYGIVAVIALAHDVLITVGIFAILGKFYGMEVNTPFVAAILTLLGYSINDTIVVFDRIRENIPKSDDDFETTINNSINQTITRSINTSFTTLLALVAIIIFGGLSIQGFALALAIGIIVGTYSSIFVASPLLVIIEQYKK